MRCALFPAQAAVRLSWCGLLAHQPLLGAQQPVNAAAFNRLHQALSLTHPGSLTIRSGGRGGVTGAALVQPPVACSLIPCCVPLPELSACMSPVVCVVRPPWCGKHNAEVPVAALRCSKNAWHLVGFAAHSKCTAAHAWPGIWAPGVGTAAGAMGPWPRGLLCRPWPYFYMCLCPSLRGSFFCAT